MASASTPTQSASRPTPHYDEMSSSELLKVCLELPPSKRARPVNSLIETRLEEIEEVLPDPLKPQAKRLVKRAQVTFSKLAQKIKTDVYQCDPMSVVRAVIEAAEIGLPIDGKLCTVLVRSNNKGTREEARWVKEAELSIQYQGLVIVARRSGQIVDAWARTVYSNDEFEAHHRGAEDFLEHDDAYDGDRGTCQGAYAQILFPGSRWRYEWMQDQQIMDEARAHSRAKDEGPWITHTDEMRKKTVLRRILKLYCDDPALGMAIAIDEREFEDEDPDHTRRRSTSLQDRIAARQQAGGELDTSGDAYQGSAPDDTDQTPNDPEEGTDQT